MRSLFSLLCFSVVILGIGCGQADGYREEFNLNIPAAEERFLEILGPPKDERIAVSAQSGTVPIDLYVIRAGNKSKAEDVIRAGKVNEIFTSKMNTASPVLEATIPTATPYVVVIANPSKKEVSVRVTIAAK